MVQELTTIPNMFGRLGKGLAEQLPKEVERSRLASGLESLSNQPNLSPFQRFTGLVRAAHEYPQVIQSGGELLRQQGINEALTARGSPGTASANAYQALPQSRQGQVPPSQTTPSVTTTAPIQAAINPYIPKSYDQILDRAGQLAHQNPKLYQGDPQKAIDAATLEDQQNQNINTALQGQRQSQQGVQERVEGELNKRITDLNAQVPGNVFNEVRDKALEDVNSGRLTEKQAADKYGKELDKISRDYNALRAVGNVDFALRGPHEVKRELQAIGKRFKERNDQENLADKYISENGLSPGKAYYLAYPVSDTKELNNAIKNLPEIRRAGTLKDPKAETRKIIPQIAKNLGKEASVLSVAEELQSRGYDPSVWLDYVDKNRKQLDLTERQARELGKPRNFFPTLNDNWLFLFSGLDKLVEQ